MRAISTVVDATVFLLLLGGAVGTLVVGTGTMQSPPTGQDRADRTAEQLVTTTMTVEYELRPTNNRSDGVEYSGLGGNFDRTAHGTTAGLLAAATRSGATIGGERVTPASGGFERVVRNETRDTISQSGARVSVTAHWEPYEDAPIDGRIHVGPEPPASADVRAATLTVDSGFEQARDRARTAARENENGTSGVARAVATSIVRGLFPPEHTRIALRGDAPTDTVTAHRYRRVARLTDARVLDVGNSSVEMMNAELVDALTARLARDLRRQFESPEVAARSVDTGDVQIVVRTWSP